MTDLMIVTIFKIDKDYCVLHHPYFIASNRMGRKSAIQVYQTSRRDFLNFQEGIKFVNLSVYTVHVFLFFYKCILEIASSLDTLRLYSEGLRNHCIIFFMLYIR